MIPSSSSSLSRAVWERRMQLTTKRGIFECLGRLAQRTSHTTPAGATSLVLLTVVAAATTTAALVDEKEREQQHKFGNVMMSKDQRRVLPNLVSNVVQWWPPRTESWTRSNNNVCFCDDSVVAATTTSTGGNPVWPAGVSAASVEQLVDECIRDKTLNIPTIPDFLERRIYRLTILVTLNAIFYAVGQIHGTVLWGHEFQLQRRRDTDDYAKNEWLDDLHSGLDERALERVADRLMANQQINQSLVPDRVERRIYANCLKLVFRLLDMIASSAVLHVCGHEVSLSVVATSKKKKLRRMNTKKVLNRAVARSSRTQIDQAKLLQEIERQQSERRRLEHEMDPNAASHDSMDMFEAQLQASLYSLILAILDDVLANTEIQLLSDRILIDIVPRTTMAKTSKKLATVGTRQVDEPAFQPSSFWKGVGVGGVLVAGASILVSGHRPLVEFCAPILEQYGQAIRAALPK